MEKMFQFHTHKISDTTIAITPDCTRSSHIGGGEDVREEEVEERPELVQVVLKRSTCQEESVRGGERAHHD